MSIRVVSIIAGQIVTGPTVLGEFAGRRTEAGGDRVPGRSNLAATAA